MKRLLLAMLVGLFFNIQAQDPPDIKPDVWLRADQYNKTSNVWTDVSGNNNHAVPVSGFQIQDEGIINFNRAITFDGRDDILNVPFDTTSWGQLTVISVYRSNKARFEQGVWGLEVNQGQELMLTTQKIKSPQSIVKYSEGNMDFPVINTTCQFLGESLKPVMDTKITLGSGSPTDNMLSAFSGSIAEYMVFERIVDIRDLQKIQSYLSIKYGTPLHYTNYLDSKGDTIWDYNANKKYSYSITGIGRDDGFLLNQKQSRNTTNPDFMVIGVGKIKETNEANTSVINEGDFLLWGDNGKSMQLEKVRAETYPYKLPVLDRKWLMTATGETVANLTTEIKVYVKNLLNDPAQCYLVIDRNAMGDFSSEDIEYIKADTITKEGFAYFDNIVWDRDHSGSDLFTFSFGMDNGLYCIDPNCFNESTGSIHIDVQGGYPPYSFELENDSIKFTSHWESGARKHTVENLEAGFYRLTVKDSENSVDRDNIRINNPDSLKLGLKESYEIKLGESLDLNAGLFVGDKSAVYTWEGDNGFYSEDNEVRIYDTGEYTIKVTNSAGCEMSSKLTVTSTQELFYHYKLYPNPSNGEYSLRINLAEKSDITIRVFNDQGALIKQKEVTGVSGHKYNGYINHPGIYFVEIETKHGKEIFKLIVN